MQFNVLTMYPEEDMDHQHIPYGTTEAAAKRSFPLSGHTHAGSLESPEIQTGSQTFASPGFLNSSPGSSVPGGSLVVSVSGGKDSTAMLLMLLERKEPVERIVFFDTTWEFPAMYAHLEKLQKHIGRRITILRPREDFTYSFAHKPVISRKTGKLGQIGRGWPSMFRRWCTGRKQEAMNCYSNGLTYRQGITLPVTQCIGYAADEEKRAEKTDFKRRKPGAYISFRYPLLEWGVTEADALQYCRKKGFDWDGLYDVFNRVSCFCCPLGGIRSAKLIYKHYPDLWKRMRAMEAMLPPGHLGRRYAGKLTLADLEARFAVEDLDESNRLCLPGFEPSFPARRRMPDVLQQNDNLDFMGIT